MPYNPELHHRKSIRLQNYDYSSNGMYHIILCTQDKQNLFFDKTKNELNFAGKMVEKIWCEIPQFYNGIYIDEYKIMPDHLHGIIFIYNENQTGQPLGVAPTLSLSDRAITGSCPYAILIRCSE
jgi:putative transposase